MPAGPHRVVDPHHERSQVGPVRHGVRQLPCSTSADVAPETARLQYDTSYAVARADESSRDQPRHPPGTGSPIPTVALSPRAANLRYTP